jgi:hypothetical protein
LEEQEIKKPKMIESEIIDIDGERIVKYGTKSYRIKLFKGRNSYRVLTKLTKYGSGLFGGVLRGVAESGEDVDAVSLLVAGSLRDAFQTIDDPELETFVCEELVANVFSNNEAFNWDDEFKGKNMLVCFDLLRQVIQYNFSPVFQELGIAALFKQKEVSE